MEKNKNKTQEQKNAVQAFFTDNDKVIVKSAINDIATIFDARKVQTEEQARFFLNSLNGVNDMFLLPYCRIAYIVRENQLYLKSKSKTFEAWFKNNFNLGKTTASYRARVGELVDESGNKSIFASDTGDFNYTQLLIIVENKISVERVEQALENGEISYNMTRKEFEKWAKPAKGINLEELGGTTETTETTEETETTEKPKKEKKELNPLDVARGSATYKKYEQKFAEMVLRCLNANDITELEKIFG